MIYQMHHQFKDGKTEFRSQREFTNYFELRMWVAKTKEEHSLPDGAEWVVCNENSRHFVGVEEKK